MGTAVEQFEVVTVERIAATEGTLALALGGIKVGGSPGGIAATIETTIDPGSSGRAAVADGKTIRLGVSRLVGESEWIVDSLAIGGLPVYANGVGSRCTKLKALSNAEMVAALDAAAGEVV